MRAPESRCTDARAILYHKHSASARTRFLRMPYGGVCALGAVPSRAILSANGAPGNLCPHPAAVVARLLDWLGLAPGSLEPEPEFRAWLTVPAGHLPVHLVRFTEVDPPFDQVARVGAAFISLTEARGLPPIEMQLLQRAYAVAFD